MDKKNYQIFLAERRPKAVVEALLAMKLPFDCAVAPLTYACGPVQAGRKKIANHDSR